MAGIFTRRLPSPKKSKYENYRSEIREDFHECCAYCLLHELLAGGRSNFELDHFKPKSKFPALEKEYTNICYSCHVCNNKKRAKWPSSKLLAQGRRFIDYCSEDFSTHFTEGEDCSWNPLTPAAEYVEAELLLNSEHLLKVRRILRKIVNAQGLAGVDWDKPTKSLSRLL